jgi:hypothetical protein
MPSIDMVSFLLELGADPNERGSSLSPWENTLRFSMETTEQLQLPKPETDKTFDLAFELPALDLPTLEMAYDVRPLQLRYLEIMTILVEAGATPTFCITMHRGYDDYSALSLTEDLLMKKFPADAAPLLKALREKLEAQKSSTRRRTSGKRNQKRARSADEDCIEVKRRSKRRAVIEKEES